MTDPTAAALTDRRVDRDTAARVRRRLRDLNDARAVIATLPNLIAQALTASAAAMGDGYGTRGDDGGGHTGISDPVGANVVRHAKVLELQAQFDEQWQTWLTATFDTERSLARLLQASGRPLESSERAAAACSGGVGLPGIEEWGRKDANGTPIRCDQPIDGRHAGMCVSCYLRRRRWEAAQRAGVPYTRRAGW